MRSWSAAHAIAIASLPRCGPPKAASAWGTSSSRSSASRQTGQVRGGACPTAVRSRRTREPSGGAHVGTSVGATADRTRSSRGGPGAFRDGPPNAISPEERAWLEHAGADLAAVWKRPRPATAIASTPPLPDPRGRCLIQDGQPPAIWQRAFARRNCPHAPPVTVASAVAGRMTGAAALACRARQPRALKRRESRAAPR